jgi:type VI secretion system protein ImpF
MIENEINARASLLDRLIDSEPGHSHESVQYTLIDFRQIRVCVIRDLENLLNSRRNITRLPPKYREARRSLLKYGLKDFTTTSPNDPQALKTIGQEIEKSIAVFEPRLKNVRVELEIGEQKEGILSFRISGLLVVDPIREPVEFDTYYDISKKAYVVTG